LHSDSCLDCFEAIYDPMPSEISSYSPTLTPVMYSMPPEHMQIPVTIEMPIYVESSPHQDETVDTPVWAPTEKIPKTEPPLIKRNIPIFETTWNPGHIKSPVLYITTEDPSVTQSPMTYFTANPTKNLSNEPATIPLMTSYSFMSRISGSSITKSTTPSKAPSVVPSLSPSKGEKISSLINGNSNAPSMPYWFQPSSPSISNEPSLVEYPDLLFINEFGDNFIEVAYIDSSDLNITSHELVFYSGDGLMLARLRLSGGNSDINGLILTYCEFPATDAPIKAVALINSVTQNIFQFLSKDTIIKASNGPTKGLLSTYIWTGTASNPDLPSFQGQRYSVSLLGNGCSFSDFIFATTNATPGEVNFGQEFSGCSERGTADSSSSPSIQVGQGISTGAIIGLAVSLFLLIAAYFSLIHTPKIGQTKRETSDKRFLKVCEAEKSEVEFERPANEDLYRGHHDSSDLPVNSSLSIIDGFQEDSVDSPINMSQPQEDVSLGAGSVSSTTKKISFSFLRGANKWSSNPIVTQSLIVNSNDQELYDDILLDEDSTKTIGESTSPGEKETSSQDSYEESDIVAPIASKSDFEDTSSTMTDFMPSIPFWSLRTLTYPKETFTPDSDDNEGTLTDEELTTTVGSKKKGKGKFNWFLPQKKDKASFHLQGIGSRAKDDLQDDGIDTDTTAVKQSSWDVKQRREKSLSRSEEVRSTDTDDISKDGSDNPQVVMNPSDIELGQKDSHKAKRGHREKGRNRIKESSSKAELGSCQSEDQQVTQEYTLLSDASKSIQIVADTSNILPPKIMEDAADIVFKLQDDDSDVSSVYLSTAYDVKSLQSDTDSMSLSSIQATAEAFEGLDNALEHHDWNAIYNITKKIRNKRETESEKNLLLAGT
jgi:hypothetical protein